MTSESILTELRKAVRGLRYPSEKDARITPFLWTEEKRPSKAAVLDRLGMPPETPCSIVRADDFFAGLTESRDWHGPEERAAAQRFALLRQIVQEHLSSVRVYRMGRARKKLVLLGKSASGGWAGLETEVLET